MVCLGHDRLLCSLCIGAATARCLPCLLSLPLQGRQALRHSARATQAIPIAVTTFQHLPQSFFARPAELAAPELIGCQLAVAGVASNKSDIGCFDYWVPLKDGKDATIAKARLLPVLVVIQLASAFQIDEIR